MKILVSWAGVLQELGSEEQSSEEAGSAGEAGSVIGNGTSWFRAEKKGVFFSVSKKIGSGEASQFKKLVQIFLSLKIVY